MTKCSVVIIVLNEARNLPRILESVSWADEILVMDSGSIDDSALICSRYPNCRILNQPFLGYGPQKRLAVAKASHDWILSLDADEVPDKEMQVSVKRLLQDGPNGYTGYYLTRRLVFMGREFKYGKEANGHILRFFDRRKGNYTAAVVHEKVEVEGPTGNLSGTLKHYSYADFPDYFRRFNEYTTLMASRMYENGITTNALGIVLRPPWVFIQYYFLRLNFLNGFPGFVYSFLTAYYKTVKYLKLYELRKSAAAD